MLPVCDPAVCVLPLCALVNVLFVSLATKSASNAWTFVPITRPKLVLAALAEVAFVPPLATVIVGRLDIPIPSVTVSE